MIILVLKRTWCFCPGLHAPVRGSNRNLSVITACPSSTTGPHILWGKMKTGGLPGHVSLSSGIGHSHCPGCRTQRENLHMAHPSEVADTEVSSSRAQLRNTSTMRTAGHKCAPPQGRDAHTLNLPIAAIMEI